MTGKIVFKDSPYSGGHEIKKFQWNARLAPQEGIYFDFHLETADYSEGYEETKDDDESESDWKAKIVWENYHNCTMSSNKWHDGGILVGTASNKLDFEAFDEFHLKADTLPLPDNFDNDEDFAFFIYLLGHDSCANHEINILKNHQNTFDIEWTGKIALTYVGDEEFRHEFSAKIQNVEFGGIHYYSEELSESDVKKLLEKYAINYG